MTPCQNLYLRPIVSGYCSKPASRCWQFLRYIATGTVAAGNERKIEDTSGPPLVILMVGISFWRILIAFRIWSQTWNWYAALDYTRRLRRHPPPDAEAGKLLLLLMTGGVIGRELWQHRSLRRRRRRRPRFQQKFHLVSFSLQTVPLSCIHQARSLEMVDVRKRSSVQGLIELIWYEESVDVACVKSSAVAVIADRTAQRRVSIPR